MRKQGRNRDAAPRRRRCARAAVAAGAVCLLLAGNIVADDGPGGRVDRVRALLEKWVETRRILSKERRDWDLGRELLNERIAVVNREVGALDERVREAAGSIAEADRKRQELIEENERHQQAAGAMKEWLAGLEKRTVALLKRLPTPIRERVKPLSQRIPAAPREAKQSISERFANIVGILNEVDKFNREVSLTQEVRSLPDGTAAEVSTLYVGIGQAYYVSGDGRAAGVGVPGAEGWDWSDAPEAAAAIRTAVAILKNEHPAAFVRLPVRIAAGIGGQ